MTVGRWRSRRRTRCWEPEAAMPRRRPGLARSRPPRQLPGRASPFYTRGNVRRANPDRAGCQAHDCASPPPPACDACDILQTQGWTEKARSRTAPMDAGNREKSLDCCSPVGVLFQSMTTLLRGARRGASTLKDSDQSALMKC